MRRKGEGRRRSKGEAVFGYWDKTTKEDKNTPKQLNASEEGKWDEEDEKKKDEK